MRLISNVNKRRIANYIQFVFHKILLYNLYCPRILRTIRFKGEECMSAKISFARRMFLYILGLFIVAIGVQLSVVAGLGLSAAAAFAFVLNKIADIGFSIGSFSMDGLGAWMLLVAVVVVIVQVIILRKDFKIYNLLQLLFAFLFSFFVAAVSPLVSWWVPANYFIKLIQLFISIAITGLGILFVVTAKLVPMPPECLIFAIIDKTKKGTVGFLRTGYDVGNVVLALLLGWLCFSSPFLGVREGTILSAVLTGLFVEVYMRFIGKPFRIFCFGKDTGIPGEKNKNEAA